MRKKLLIFLFCFSLLPSLLADEGECPKGTEPFSGASKEIKTGECSGKWSLLTFIGDYHPIDLPAEYQAQNARIRGCFHLVEDKGCMEEGILYRAVSIDSVWPD